MVVYILHIHGMLYQLYMPGKVCSWMKFSTTLYCVTCNVKPNLINLRAICEYMVLAQYNYILVNLFVCQMSFCDVNRHLSDVLSSFF